MAATNIPLALILILISSIIGAFSTLNFKLGAAHKINLKNKNFIYAISLAAFSFLFYLYALKQAPLTFIYLTASISYIWAVVLGRYALKEKINQCKLAGIVTIVLGIIIMNI